MMYLKKKMEKGSSDFDAEDLLCFEIMQNMQDKQKAWGLMNKLATKIMKRYLKEFLDKK